MKKIMRKKEMVEISKMRFLRLMKWMLMDSWMAKKRIMDVRAWMMDVTGMKRKEKIKEIMKNRSDKNGRSHKKETNIEKKMKGRKDDLANRTVK